MGCYCVPKEGESCSHGAWTGAVDRGGVEPVKPAGGGGGGGGGAQRATRQAKKPSGPSAAFRQGIDASSLLCMPGDSDDETADGESIWWRAACKRHTHAHAHARAACACTCRMRMHVHPHGTSTVRARAGS